MDGVGTSDCCARGFGGEGTGGGVTLRGPFGRDSFKTWEFHCKLNVGKKKKGKYVTSFHSNGISSRIFLAHILPGHIFFFFLFKFKPNFSPRKNGIYQHYCAYLNICGRTKRDFGWKKNLKEFIFEGSTA